jgi:hypothetical protein
VIQISQLKKAITPDIVVTSKLPPDTSILQLINEPEKVLDQKLVQRKQALLKRVLVQWKGLPSNMTTW